MHCQRVLKLLVGRPLSSGRRPGHEQLATKDACAQGERLAATVSPLDSKPGAKLHAAADRRQNERTGGLAGMRLRAIYRLSGCSSRIENLVKQTQ